MWVEHHNITEPAVVEHYTVALVCGSKLFQKQKQELCIVPVSYTHLDVYKRQIYAFGGHRKNKLIVTFGEQKAKELYDEYSFFDKEVVYYPSKDVLFYQSDIRGNLLTAERIRALKAIHEQESVTLVTTFDALMNTMAPIEKMWENVLTLEQGQLLDLKEIQAALIRMGYEKEYQVQTMGQFSVCLLYTSTPPGL